MFCFENSNTCMACSLLREFCHMGASALRVLHGVFFCLLFKPWCNDTKKAEELLISKQVFLGNSGGKKNKKNIYIYMRRIHYFAMTLTIIVFVDCLSWGSA